MKIDKKKILTKIADWNKRVAFLQNEKAKLEKDILFRDIELNKIMIEYDKLCKKLLTK